MKGPTAPVVSAIAALDASGVLINHQLDRPTRPRSQPSPPLSLSSSSDQSDTPCAPPSAASPELGPAEDDDDERAFSDVSSLRSYELDESDGSGGGHGSAPVGAHQHSSAWLTIGTSSAGGGSRDRPTTTSSRMSGDGNNSTGTSWSSRSSEGSLSASSVVSASPSPSVVSSSVDRHSHEHESETESEPDEGDQRPRTTAAGRAPGRNDDESLGGSYADLEPSLYSDPTLSSEAFSYGVAPPARSGQSSGIGRPACELDFPDPANVSASFTESMASLPVARFSPTCEGEAGKTQTFRTGGSRKKLNGRQQPKPSTPIFQPTSSAASPARSGRGDAAAAGLLSFAMSGQNSFVSDATWGSFNTPTASGLLGPHAAQSTRNDLEPSADSVEKAGSSSGGGEKVDESKRLLKSLPERVRIILLGSRPTKADRQRLIDRLFQLAGELLGPSSEVDGSLIALHDRSALEDETEGPVLLDVRDLTAKFGKGKTARTSVDIDDLTRLPLPTALADEETDLDRYIRSLGRLAPSSILIVQFIDGLTNFDNGDGGGPTLASTSIALGLLRFTLSSSTGHATRVLPVDLSASDNDDEGGERPLQKAFALALDEMEELRGVEGAVAVWGGILRETAGTVKPTPTVNGPESRAMLLVVASVLLYVFTFSTPPKESPALQPGNSAVACSVVEDVHTLPSFAVDIEPPTLFCSSASATAARSTVMADSAVPVCETPLTIAIVTPSEPSPVTTAVATVVVTRVQKSSAEPSLDGSAKQPSFPRLPGGGRCCSDISASPRTTTASAIPLDSVASLGAKKASTELVPSQDPSSVAPAVGVAVDLTSDVFNRATNTFAAFTALITFDNAQALARVLAWTAALVYEAALEPSVLLALELAEAMRLRTERVWKRVDSELWLAQRGVGRLGRTLSSLFASGNASSVVDGRPEVPATYADAKPLSYTLLDEMREVVHVASSELRRSGEVVGRHSRRAVDGGRAKGGQTLRDARRGLEMLFLKSGELQREMRAKAAESWPTKTTADTTAEGS